jgi:diguanylate cyclase (GGDEF)-like protein
MRALVHFEVAIAATFGESLGAGGGHVRLVDNNGLVLIDSKLPNPTNREDAPLGFPSESQFRSVVSKFRDFEVHQQNVGSESAAMLQVPPLDGNQNSWFVVSSAPAQVSWNAGIGPGSLLLLLGALVVLVLAWNAERSHQQSLRALTLTDDLTKLANRVLMRDRFEQAIRNARRDRTQAAVLTLDLDEFKSVNDTLGHHHGDQLLQLVADRLRGVIREVDTLARLGGDEFAIVMPSIDSVNGPIALAERVAVVLNENYMIAKVPVHVGASIGIATYPTHGETIEELMQHADVAMYRAKNNGLEFAVYSDEDKEYSSRQLQLIAELRDAVYGEQLELHYQPKFDLASERLIGVEALVRWRHPEFGLISPVEFIGAAERTGLIRQLTKWVLKTSLLQLSLWLADGADITVAINLSPRSLTDQSVFEDVRGALEEANVPANRLVLEVTETSFIADPDRSIAALKDLQDLGLSVSIDDFGTGYSSLTYLRNLPVDEVKIDKSFVAGVTTNSADASIVQSTIDLAHALGFVVVAEGIEDQATLEFLSRLGCDIAQGFHLCRPQLPAELAPLVATVSRSTPLAVS